MDRGQTNDFYNEYKYQHLAIIKRNVFTLFNTLNFDYWLFSCCTGLVYDLFRHLLQCHYGDHDRDALSG